MKVFRNILNDTAGATAIEYGLIASLIAVAIMTSVGGIGSQLSNTFSKTSASMATSNS